MSPPKKAPKVKGDIQALYKSLFGTSPIRSKESIAHFKIPKKLPSEMDAPSTSQATPPRLIPKTPEYRLDTPPHIPSYNPTPILSAPSSSSSSPISKCPASPSVPPSTSSNLNTSSPPTSPPAKRRRNRRRAGRAHRPVNRLVDSSTQTCNFLISCPTCYEHEMSF